MKASTQVSLCFNQSLSVAKLKIYQMNLCLTLCNIIFAPFNSDPEALNDFLHGSETHVSMNWDYQTKVKGVLETDRFEWIYLATLYASIVGIKYHTVASRHNTAIPLPPPCSPLSILLPLQVFSCFCRSLFFLLMGVLTNEFSSCFQPFENFLFLKYTELTH